MGSSSNPSAALDDRGRRHLHRAGDLEPEAVEELDGGGHSARVELGVQTQGPQPRLLHQGSGGEPVVPGAHDDGIEVRHRPRLTRNLRFCQY